MNLKQSTAIHLERYQDLHLSVDFERETALLDGTLMKLPYKAFALLALLVRHPGQLIPRDTLLMLVWGYGADIRTRTLDVHIRRLRRALSGPLFRFRSGSAITVRTPTEHSIATLLPEGSNAWPKNETASLAPINPHKPALGLHDETAIPRCHSHR